MLIPKAAIRSSYPGRDKISKFLLLLKKNQRSKVILVFGQQSTHRQTTSTPSTGRVITVARVTFSLGHFCPLLDHVIEQKQRNMMLGYAFITIISVYGKDPLQAPEGYNLV